MHWVFLCSVLSLPSLLSAQSCSRLVGDDLASSDAESTTGLIAAALSETETLTYPPSIQLLRFTRVCESTSSVVGMFRYVSVVAEYTRNGTLTQSQFEYSCQVLSNVWGIVVSGRSTFIVTTPPDAALNTSLRTDCHQCLSPLRPGSSSDSIHHCSGEMECYNGP